MKGEEGRQRGKEGGREAGREEGEWNNDDLNRFFKWTHISHIVQRLNCYIWKQIPNAVQ